jgi:hypothetical protein
MTPTEERRVKLLTALKEALAEDSLPYVVRTVADGFEAMGIRIGIGVIKQGDPTPMVENRIQSSDFAGMAASSLGHKLGAFLTTLSQPRPRRPGPACRPQPRRR